MTTRKMLFMITALTVLLGNASLSMAQETIDIQTFNPHLAPRTVFSTEGSSIFGHMSPGVGIILNYASRPLVLTSQREGREDRKIAVVDQQLAGHVMLGLGLFDVIQLDFGFAGYGVNDGDTSILYNDGRGRDFSGGGTGDVHLRIKGNVFSGKRFGLALALEGSMPSGDTTAFLGDARPTLTPSVMADAKFGKILLALNTSVQLREVAEVSNLNLGPDLDYRLGAQWLIMNDIVSLNAEVFGRSQLLGADDGQFDINGNPLEFLVGVKLHTPAGITVTSGAGSSIISGIGAPEFRAIVGLTYAKPAYVAPVAKDSDNDGLVDEKDACPNKPEDKDGFQDDDGCPDLDDDNDGVNNDVDKCPNKPEDKDDYKDADGCPDPDNDNDGIMDKEDKCPMKAEDKDGFEDKDGCPDPDNDKDGVADTADKCPNKAGKSANGCPVIKVAPRRKFTKIVLKEKNIELLEKVFFELNKATIQPKSYALLDEMVELFKAYPQIKLVEIAGHTDLKGKRAKNQTLSENRAKAVRAYLIKKGVDQARLKAVGYGMSKPLVKKEKTKDDRAKNRRVEFNILKQEKIMEKKLVPTSKTAPTSGKKIDPNNLPPAPKTVVAPKK